MDADYMSSGEGLTGYVSAGSRPGTGDVLMKLNKTLDSISKYSLPEKSGRKNEKSVPLVQLIADAYYFLGLIYELDYSDYNNAINAYQQVILTYPENDNIPDAQFQLGELYYKQGHFQDAYNAYTELCNNFPANPKCTAAKSKLKTVSGSINPADSAEDDGNR